MLLSIIIVSYNVKYFTEQCIDSILRSSEVDLREIEIFVVDNNSSDGSIAYLRKRFSQHNACPVHFIANKRNAGFGKANNQALQRAKGQYILFLNPDTLLTEHTLHEVLECAGKQEQLGAMGVKMLHSNGRFALESRRGLPTPWVALCKMTGLTSLFPRTRLFGKYYMRYLDEAAVCDIDIVSGAFMLVPHKVIERTGSFDEQFFMYGEDIDLSYRFLKQGYRNSYCPTPILHYKGESTHKSTYKYVHVFYEAMLIFFQKHYRHYNLLLSIPIKAAIILKGMLALCSQQSRYARRFLHPRSVHRNERMLYIGRNANLVKQLALDYELQIDCLDHDAKSLPEGHLTPGIDSTNYLHVTYDLESFPTSLILRAFEKRPQAHCHIGTFNPRNGVLITGSQVLTLDE